MLALVLRLVIQTGGIECFLWLITRRLKLSSTANHRAETSMSRQNRRARYLELPASVAVQMEESGPAHDKAAALPAPDIQIATPHPSVANSSTRKLMNARARAVRFCLLG